MAAAKAGAKALTKFTINEAGEGYTLHIESEGGDTLELTATAEQLDLIDEALDTLLSRDEGAVDEVDGDEDDLDEDEEDED